MKDSTKQVLKLIQMSVSFLMVFLAFNGLFHHPHFTP